MSLNEQLRHCSRWLHFYQNDDEKQPKHVKTKKIQLKSSQFFLEFNCKQPIGASHGQFYITNCHCLPSHAILESITFKPHIFCFKMKNQCEIVILHMNFTFFYSQGFPRIRNCIMQHWWTINCSKMFQKNAIQWCKRKKKKNQTSSKSKIHIYFFFCVLWKFYPLFTQQTLFCTMYESNYNDGSGVRPHKFYKTQKKATTEEKKKKKKNQTEQSESTVLKKTCAWTVIWVISKQVMSS